MNRPLGITLAICLIIGTCIGFTIRHMVETTDKTTAQSPPDIASLPLAAQGAHEETPPRGLKPPASSLTRLNPVILNDALRMTAIDTMKHSEVWTEAGLSAGVLPSAGIDGRIFVMKNDRKNGRLVAVVVMNTPYSVDAAGDKVLGTYLIADVDCSDYSASKLLAWMGVNPNQVVASGTSYPGPWYHPADLVLATKYFCTHAE